MKKAQFVLTGLVVFSPLLFASLVAADNVKTRLGPSVRVIVNSNQDGAIAPDTSLTLREAIEIVNGTLPLNKLSQAETELVRSLAGNAQSKIEFNLRPGQTTIQLTDILPPLASPGLVIDGTTQPGYKPTKSATAEIAIPFPVVAITPASGREVFRGLTVVADRITIRGLSLYGFTSRPGATVGLPPADIFIAQPSDSNLQPPNYNFPLDKNNIPPKDILIEQNWLGITPDEKMPSTTSAFGVSVFDSLGTTIRRNRIANHDGSGIITSVRAENLQVQENIIVGNGIAGMPDAIRLEGLINRSQISSNLICGNDGSGVYLFKPDGSVQIQDNNIKFNGRRLRRAAIYLMGNDHQVTDNQISHQTGPGVVVTSYPKSDRNKIQGNRFAGLEGLSIDLNTQQNVGVEDYQRGDGVNPPRNSHNRRKDTGNSAINAPQFLSREFLNIDNKVRIDGIADRGSLVEIYRIEENTSDDYGPLNQPLATVPTNAKGRFTLSVTNLAAGTRLSAIATHPKYGTSEPAFNAVVSSVDSEKAPKPPLEREAMRGEIPQCTTPMPIAPVVTPPVPTPAPQLPELRQPVRLQVPQNVHFALDEYTIRFASAEVLDQIAAVLLEHPSIIIDIQGHTDPRASDAYNMELGRKRAMEVRNYLLHQGIPPERMTIRSFGETKPRNVGTNSLDYARDRRVEVVFKDVRGVELIVEEQEGDLQPENFTRGGR